MFEGYAFMETRSRKFHKSCWLRRKSLLNFLSGGDDTEASDVTLLVVNDDSEPNEHFLGTDVDFLLMIEAPFISATSSNRIALLVN